jgi:hypothetical protein
MTAAPTWFRAATLVGDDGVLYEFDADDLASLSPPAYDWHGPGDPSSWLCAATVARARARFSGRLSRVQAVELCAATLGITVEKLEQTLDWNANYMAFHDGGSPDENHVWPPDVQ